MKRVLSACVLLLAATVSRAQLAADAGTNKSLCLGSSVVIGGAPTASGGTTPYTYTWTPGTSLNSTTIANPTATPTMNTTYYVTVKDAANNTKKDSVKITIYPVSYMNAGPDTGVCLGAGVQLGSLNNSSGGGVTFAWSPAASLNNASAPRPVASPTVTTTYMLVITSTTCSNDTSYVKVIVHPLPVVDAGPSFTIYEGQNVTLQGSGAAQYFWSPTNTLTYANTQFPDAEPITTTIYHLSGVSPFGCVGYDTTVVYVIPDDSLVIYNTFTPNGDGNNDLWYIGNIWKYPNNKVDVYNRYGKLVYTSSPYVNLWDGKSFGELLPSATYYYIIDTGDDKMGKLKGSVTIIR